MVKIYAKSPHQSAPISASVRDLLWHALIRRKVLVFSFLFLLVTLPILYLVIKYQSPIQAAQIEKNISRRMTEGFLLRASLNKGWQSQKKQHDNNQRTSNIKKQETNIGLIKLHNFILLTNETANNQQRTLITIPNSITGIDGLSSDEIKIGTTKEPKNKVPTLMKISANLSTWPAERMGNSAIFNISKDYIRIINSFQELA